jgi:hypothetical protein
MVVPQGERLGSLASSAVLPLPVLGGWNTRALLENGMGVVR